MQHTLPQTPSSKYTKRGQEAEWGALISVGKGVELSMHPLISRASNLDLPPKRPLQNSKPTSGF